MSKTLAVFLRGINVGGVSIAMADLREALALPGVAAVQTILATGNAVLTLDAGNADPAQWKADIEQRLHERFRYDAHVFVLGAAQVEQVAAEAQAMEVPAGCHLYVLLLEDHALFEELNALFATLAHMPQERFLPMSCGAFWVVPRGSTVESPFGNKALGDRRYKSRLTSRNVNTWHKVLQAMEKNR